MSTVSVFTQPFYDPKTFSTPALFREHRFRPHLYLGLTVSRPLGKKRRIRDATSSGDGTGLPDYRILASIEVYVAQLIWPSSTPFKTWTPLIRLWRGAPESHTFQVVNFTLLVRHRFRMGHSWGGPLDFYGMGRDNAIPKSFFGAIDAQRGIPRNNVIFVGVLALLGPSS